MVIDMGYFTARDDKPASYCEARVRGCDVYVGLIGLRYGSAVRDRPQVSYTELEFDVATEAGKPRLIFLLDEDTAVPIPPGRLLDRDLGLQVRQQALRAKMLDSGVLAAKFARSEQLEVLLLQALQENCPEPKFLDGQQLRRSEAVSIDQGIVEERISSSQPMLRVRRVTEHGESYEVEIFDVGIAEKWITNSRWGSQDWIGSVDG